METSTTNPLNTTVKSLSSGFVAAAQSAKIARMAESLGFGAPDAVAGEPTRTAESVAKEIGSMAAGLGSAERRTGVGALLARKTQEVTAFAQSGALESIGRSVSGGLNQTAPTSSNAEFVAGVYQKHLNRPPEANNDGTPGDGPTFWAKHLGAGTMNRSEVDEAIRLSPEGQNMAAIRARTDAMLQTMVSPALGDAMATVPVANESNVLTPDVNRETSVLKSVSSPAREGVTVERLGKVMANVSDVLNQFVVAASSGGEAANQAFKSTKGELSKLLSQLGRVIAPKGVEHNQRFQLDGDSVAVANSLNERDRRVDEPMPPLNSFIKGAVESKPLDPLKSVDSTVMPTREAADTASSLLVGCDFSSFGSDRVSSLLAIKNLLTENGIDVRGVRDITTSGPRSMFTADYHLDRLNLYLNDAGAIDRVNFG